MTDITPSGPWTPSHRFEYLPVTPEQAGTVLTLLRATWPHQAWDEEVQALWIADLLCLGNLTRSIAVARWFRDQPLRFAPTWGEFRQEWLRRAVEDLHDA